MVWESISADSDIQVAGRATLQTTSRVLLRRNFCPHFRQRCNTLVDLTTGQREVSYCASCFKNAAKDIYNEFIGKVCDVSEEKLRFGIGKAVLEYALQSFERML